MSKRKFDTLEEHDKIIMLLHSISQALFTSPELKKKWRTDFYAISKQYLGRYGVKNEDYDLIKNLTIDEIKNKVLHGEGIVEKTRPTRGSKKN